MYFLFQCIKSVYEYLSTTNYIIPFLFIKFVYALHEQAFIILKIILNYW